MADAEKDGKEPVKRDYISALLSARAGEAVDPRGLLMRVDAKTEGLRTPYSANISRKDASILAALAPPGQEKARLGAKAELAPSRETSRPGFQALEWDQDREPMTVDELVEAAEQLAPEGAPPVEQAAPPSSAASQPPAGERPAEPAEAETAVPGPEATEPVEGAAPAAADEVVVQTRPGQRPREGGEFPGELMEDLEESPTEDAAVMAQPARKQRAEAPTIVAYRHKASFDEVEEAPTEESRTLDDMAGSAPGTHKHWPSPTGLELHIDGFDDLARVADICPRCGRRTSLRNRLLTCTDCGVVACEGCEIRTKADVDSPYYYDWKFELPLCIRCFEKAYNIQKSLAKAKSSLGMGNFTYAYFHAQQALKVDPESRYAGDARGIIEMVDKRRREAAEQDESWRKQRDKLSRTTVVHER